nr:hypothetical protein [uncultured Desulfobulbus sp.]
MKIVMFQYNREASAILSQNALGQAKISQKRLQESPLPQSYNDRFLWEGATSFTTPPQGEYIIPGNWQ